MEEDFHEGKSNGNFKADYSPKLKLDPLFFLSGDVVNEVPLCIVAFQCLFSWQKLSQIQISH